MYRERETSNIFHGHRGPEDLPDGFGNVAGSKPREARI